MKDFADKVTVADFFKEIPMTEYIANYRDTERFIALCRQCPNYGNSRGCPPFEFDVDALLNQWSNVFLIAKITPPTGVRIPLSEVSKLFLPERQRIERRLLEMEREYGGRASAFVGTCLHCPSARCERASGRACLHPDKVRPSLEAFGFNLDKTLSDLFGFELHWSNDGFVPEYLTLVTGFFHNASSRIVF